MAVCGRKSGDTRDLNQRVGIKTTFVDKEWCQKCIEFVSLWSHLCREGRELTESRKTGLNL